MKFIVYINFLHVSHLHVRYYYFVATENE